MTITYEFDTMEQFRGFEQALENRVITTRDRKADEDSEVTDGQDSIETIASEMLDRAQRTRHGHQGDQPLTFEFVNSAELTVGIASTLAAGHMTDVHGARGDNDADRVKRMFASMAADFESMHPNDEIIDQININISGLEDE